MKIALDYDGTYTADPEFWHEFLGLAQKYGHQVVCVTCRRETEENVQDVVLDGKTPVYFTGHGSKLWYDKTYDLGVDIWIDDDPRVVVEGV